MCPLAFHTLFREPLSAADRILRNKIHSGNEIARVAKVQLGVGVALKILSHPVLELLSEVLY
jgi:hypothetical protein